jgi:hypothetical protein
MKRKRSGYRDRSLLSPIFQLFVHLVALLELFHPSGGINHLSFAGEEWMAFTAKFNPELLFRGAGGESVATRTNYFCVFKIFGMNLLFHYVSAA